MASTLDRWPPNRFISRLPASLRLELLESGRLRIYHTGSNNLLATKEILLIDRGVLLLEHGEGMGGAGGVFCGPGDIVGAAHVLAVDENCAGRSFVAKTTVHTVVVSADTFGEFISKTAAARALLADFAYQNYLEKVRRARNTLVVNDRVKLFLEDMAVQFGKRDMTSTARRVRIQINLTQADIARAVGASMGAVEGVLRDLRSQNIIETGYRWTSISLPYNNDYVSAADLDPAIGPRI